MINEMNQDLGQFVFTGEGNQDLNWGRTIYNYLIRAQVVAVIVEAFIHTHMHMRTTLPCYIDH